MGIRPLALTNSYHGVPVWTGTVAIKEFPCPQCGTEVAIELPKGGGEVDTSLGTFRSPDGSTTANGTGVREYIPAEIGTFGPGYAAYTKYGPSCGSVRPRRMGREARVP